MRRVAALGGCSGLFWGKSRSAQCRADKDAPPIRLPPAHEPRDEQQPSMLDLWLAKTAKTRATIMPRRDNDFFRVYKSNGEATTLETVMEAMAKADAVFVGETHEDPKL